MKLNNVSIGVLSVLMLVGIGCNGNVTVEQNENFSNSQAELETTIVESDMSDKQAEKTSDTTIESSKPDELSKEEMEAELKAFFELEKGRKVEKIQVVLQDGNFVKGELRFESDVAGEIFFVVKQNTTWVIASEGNGQVSCDLKTQYGFPQTFLDGCVK